MGISSETMMFKRGDPTYITSHKDSRTKLRRFERYELLEELVKSYLASAAKK